MAQSQPFGHLFYRSKKILHLNSILQINAGNSNIWTDPWFEGWEDIHSSLNLSHNTQNLPNQVSELWDPHHFSWNAATVLSTFSQPVAYQILQTSKVLSSDPDNLCWKPSTQGSCTTKEAYKCLRSQANHILPSTGPRHISPPALLILNKTWKHKTIPPRIKAFTWRLLRHSLATGLRAGLLSNNIDKACKMCGKIENDFHLFFECDFARLVWFSADPPLRADCLTPENDGLQGMLHAILTTSFSDSLLQQVLTRLWYLWKACNDLRFNNKKWSVHRVGFEVMADITTSSPLDSIMPIFRSSQIPAPQAHRIQPFRPQQALLTSVNQMNSFSLPTSFSVQEHLQIRIMSLTAAGCSDIAIDPDRAGVGSKIAGMGVFLDLRNSSYACRVHITARVQVPTVILGELEAIFWGVKCTADLLSEPFCWGTDSLLAV